MCIGDNKFEKLEFKIYICKMQLTIVFHWWVNLENILSFCNAIYEMYESTLIGKTNICNTVCCVEQTCIIGQCVFVIFYGMIVWFSFAYTENTSFCNVHKMVKC